MSRHLLSFSLALLWLGAGTARAQIFVNAAKSPFAGPTSDPDQIVTGDFNRDGKLDYATSGYFTNTVTIMLSDGNGGFVNAPGSPIAVGNNPYGLAAADLNLDGALDLVVANGTDNTITVLLGNGHGGFASLASGPIEVGTSPRWVIVTDFDGDHKPDVAVSSPGNGTVSVLRGTGTGGFTAFAGSPIAVPGAYILASADFNGDGKPDLAVTNHFTNGSFTVLIGNGNGTFTPAIGSPFATGGNVPYGILAADFNGDGKADVAVTNSASNNVAIFLGSGTGSFSAAGGSPLATGPNSNGLAAADLNNDGKLDLVVVAENGPWATILLGSGNGTFVPAAGSPILLPGNPQDVAIGDFNNDGLPDLLTANTSSANVSVLQNNLNKAFFSPSQLTFYASVGQTAPLTITTSSFTLGPAITPQLSSNQPWLTIGFGPPRGIKIIASPAGLSAGIYRGQVRNLASGVYGGTVSVTLYVTKPTGSFAPAPSSPFAVGNGPTAVASGDFNGDGKTDLVVLNSGLGSTGANKDNLSVLLGDGSGGFAAAPGSPVPVGSAPSAVATGDLDGDGRLDLVIANLNSNTVSVLLGNGKGGFVAATGPYTVGNQPKSVAIGDFNSDGIPDIAAVSTGNNSPTLTILLGDGFGAFYPAATPAALGYIPYQVVTADFNLDGIPDLAIANPGGNVNVLLGTGTGGFTQAPGSPYASPGASAVAAGDLNADGSPDLVVANNAGSVTVLLGDGTGRFQPAAGSPIATGAYADAIAIGDLNGDGIPDVAVGTPNDPSVTSLHLLFGDGAGALSGQVAYACGAAAPGGLVISDFNLDGLPDIACVGADNIVVLLGKSASLTPSASWSITQSHINNLSAAQPLAYFIVSVSNTKGSGPTSGNVTVTEFPPAGVQLISMSGANWTCSGTSCTRSDSLILGGTYPPIAVAVAIRPDATGQVANLASVAGGGLAQDFSNDIAILNPAFTDVALTDSFLPAIDLLRESGITTGCQPTAYCGSDNTTQQQMAVFIVRSVLGTDNFSYSAVPYFSDVPVNHLYFKWIQKLQDLGIAVPCSATQFCPDQAVTRGVMAVLIVRARYGTPTPPNSPATAYFTDVPSIYPFFTWIQKMKQIGITTGCSPTTYCPDNPVSRGEMAVFIMRGMFNLLLPSGTPLLWASPSSIQPGHSATIMIQGQGTNFANGSTQIAAGSGVAVGDVTVYSPTLMAATFTVQANAPVGPRSILVLTGSQEATLPNSFFVGQ